MSGSIRDELTAAFDASAEAPAKEAVTETPVVPAADVPSDDKAVAAAVPSNDDRARDDRGRFAKQVAEVAASITTDQAPTAAAEVPVAPIEPPSSWSDDAKAIWATLTPEARKVVADREAEAQKALTQRAQEQAEYRRKYSELDQVLEPYRQRLALSGVTEGQAIRQLLAAQDLLTRDPVQGLRWLASQYRVDPATLMQQQQSDEDPKYASLSQELQSMRQMLEDRSRQEREQTTMTLAQQITSWASEQKDGKPVREHYATVEDDVAAIIPAIREMKPMASTQEVLQEAYDRAIWANPEVRNRLLQSQQQAEESKRLAEAARKADEAKKAAVSVVGAPGGATARTQGSVREELMRAWDSRAA